MESEWRSRVQVLLSLLCSFFFLSCFGVLFSVKNGDLRVGVQGHLWICRIARAFGFGTFENNVTIFSPSERE